jgi:hypothetical protein
MSTLWQQTLDEKCDWCRWQVANWVLYFNSIGVPDEIVDAHKDDVCERCRNKSLDEKCYRCRWEVAGWLHDLKEKNTEHIAISNLGQHADWIADCRLPILEGSRPCWDLPMPMKLPDEIVQAHSDDVCGRCGNKTLCEKCFRCRWEVAGWLHDLKEKNTEDIAISNLGQHADAVRKRMTNKEKTAKTKLGNIKGG